MATESPPTHQRQKTWLNWIIEGNAHQRRGAIRMLHESPDGFAGEPWVACAIGDEPRLRDALVHDPAWVNRPAGPLDMPPLVLVSHSRLILEHEFEAGLLACAAVLLRHGADVDGTWTDPRWPDSPLSVLYGAAGRTHHAGMTRLFLDAGANPDDGESLYHSVESPDPTCLRLLIEAGARVVGTNAIARVLDYDRLDSLQLLLSRGGDARERPWIHHALLRGRSLAHVRTLLDAGADPRAVNDAGISLFRFAQTHGRTDVVEVLRTLGIDEELSEEERFIAACARHDETTARAIVARAPDILARLTSQQLQTMPRLAHMGDIAAVRTMLALGWPRETKTAWDASALNLAVSRGDAAMARLLLDEGADWRTPHGFGNNVLGTLSYSSQTEDFDELAPRDVVGCAQALVAHGVPLSAFEPYRFSAQVTQALDALRRSSRAAAEKGAAAGTHSRKKSTD